MESPAALLDVSMSGVRPVSGASVRWADESAFLPRDFADFALAHKLLLSPSMSRVHESGPARSAITPVIVHALPYAKVDSFAAGVNTSPDVA